MFKAVHYTGIASERVEEAGSKNVLVKWLITEKDGAENFAMRFFEVEPGGQTPYHSHNWEHEVFVLDGRGLVVCDGSEKEVTSGYVVFIPPNTEHCLKNVRNTKFCFLCLIPHKKHLTT